MSLPRSSAVSTVSRCAGTPRSRRIRGRTVWTMLPQPTTTKLPAKSSPPTVPRTCPPRSRPDARQKVSRSHNFINLCENKAKPIARFATLQGQRGPPSTNPRPGSAGPCRSRLLARLLLQVAVGVMVRSPPARCWPAGRWGGPAFKAPRPRISTGSWPSTADNAGPSTGPAACRGAAILAAPPERPPRRGRRSLWPDVHRAPPDTCSPAPCSTPAAVSGARSRHGRRLHEPTATCRGATLSHSWPGSAARPAAGASPSCPSCPSSRRSGRPGPGRSPCRSSWRACRWRGCPAAGRAACRSR